MHRILGRPLGLAATAILAVGMATTGSAAASPAGSASVDDGTLTVVGTRGADRLALRLAPGDPSTLQVDHGDDGTVDQSFDRSTFTRVDVLLLSGDDRFRVDQAGGAFADEALTVDAGRGDDSVATGDGNDLVMGGNGDDTVDGNRGADTAELGAGDDIFIWDPGDGSDGVDGGSGSDALVFNGANGPEVMRLSAVGRDSLFVREPGTVRMAMHDVEVLELVALGGADAITVDDLSGSTFRHADIDLSVQGAGDRQADLVTVSGSAAADRITVDADGEQVGVDGLAAGTTLSGGDADLDRLQISALDGNDDVDVDDAAAALIGISVDLGPGQL